MAGQSKETHPLTIMVRSRRFVCGGWITEWTETTSSWRKAWAIVQDACSSRDDCRVWSVDATKRSAGFWFVDLGGNEELEDLRAE